jgi:hypothetical protein
MAEDTETLVTALNGAPIVRRETDWLEGYFAAGHVAIANIVTEGGRVRFELRFPTARGDREDYIWDSERKAGTTDKVKIMRAKRKVDARIVAIRRRVEASEDDKRGLVEYCLTFDAPRYLANVRAEEPLQVEFTWTHRDSFMRKVPKEEEVVIAVAGGTVQMD